MTEEAAPSSRKPDLYMGVDLGGTKILSAVIDENGGILASEKKKTKADKPWREVIARIARCARKAAENAGVDIAELRALGIGAPGALNPHTGVIHLAPNLHWKDVPLKDILEQELGLPVFMNNDVNIGTLGERRMGAGKGMKNVVGIFVGTGIGGGLILNGKVYEGSSFMAGEVGHIPIKKKGPLCGCGNKGCFESVAGRLAIVRDISKALQKGEKSMITDEVGGDYSRIKSRLLAKAWRERDPLAVKIMKKAAKQIGRGVATVVTLLNPDAVILGGGLIEAIDDDFLDYILKKTKKNCFPALRDQVQLLRAELGDDAGILGAAFYAMDCVSEK